jgi:hypothetical protein
MELPDLKDLFRNERDEVPVKRIRLYRAWTDVEEGNLIAGVSQFGIGNWEAIRLDPTNNLT